MKIVSKLLLASAVALSFAAPSFAAVSTLQDHNVYIFSHGKMMNTQVSDTTLTLIKREFRPMEFGTMIYASGGKLYIAQDHKMKSGKMLSAEVFGKDLGAASLQ
jgi:hypothetical protein